MTPLDDKGSTFVTADLAGEEAPPVAIPTKSGDLYYLLDDFNHHHQHAVLAGRGSLRYAVRCLLRGGPLAQLRCFRGCPHVCS